MVFLSRSRMPSTACEPSSSLSGGYLQWPSSHTIFEILTALVGCLNLSQSTILVACCAGEVVARYASVGGFIRKCPHMGDEPLMSSSGSSRRDAPGSTSVTEMPNGSSSYMRLSVRPSMAHFVAQ